ncbi:MAG: hypothetical protein J6V44_09025 [Methanobrevibacter sp.]|nr:hypothetical protein [Methanobrevibacter sp.]
MLLDMQTLFSDAQAVTVTAASTNVVQTAIGKLKEIAFGTPLPLLIQVVEAFAGCTSVKVALQTSATEDFAAPVVLAETAAIPVADLVAGYRFPINFMPKGNLGYTRIYYTVNGTATAGKIDAGFVAGHDNSYQDM